MQLYLMRHGEALNGAGDETRTLSPVGIAAVSRMAQHFRSLGLRFHRILSSPLLRSRQTAERIARTLEIDRPVEIFEELLSGEEPSAFRRLLASSNPGHTLLAVGHQPLLGRLVTELAFGDARDGLVVSPATVCWVELPDISQSTNGLLRGVWDPETLAGS